MTGVQFCAGSAPSVFPVIAAPQNWLVRFRYSLGGETPETFQTVVKSAPSEASAIAAAIRARLGRSKCALHSLEMLAVHKTA